MWSLKSSIGSISDFHVIGLNTALQLRSFGLMCSPLCRQLESLTSRPSGLCTRIIGTVRRERPCRRAYVSRVIQVHSYIELIRALLSENVLHEWSTPQYCSVSASYFI